MARGDEVNLRACLLLLRNGRLRFARFAQRTAGTWQRLARYLVARWPLPACCELRDVEQELLLAVAQLVPRWDPSRGVEIARFVVWNACNRAKRWMHRQRGATRTGGHAPGVARSGPDWKPSVLPVPASWIDAPAAQGGEDRARAGRFERITAKRFAEQRPSDPYAVADLRLVLDSPLTAGLDPRQRLALAALAAEHDVDLAAERLYADPDARWRCRLWSERHARALVRRAITSVAASATGQTNATNRERGTNHGNDADEQGRQEEGGEEGR
jgi:hypothetical protein